MSPLSFWAVSYVQKQKSELCSMLGIKGRIQPIDLKWRTLFRCLYSGAGAQDPSAVHRNIAPLRWLKTGIFTHAKILLWKWWPVDNIARSLLLSITSLWLSNLQDKSVLGSLYQNHLQQFLVLLPCVQVLTNAPDPAYLFHIYSICLFRLLTILLLTTHSDFTFQF